MTATTRSRRVALLRLYPHAWRQRYGEEVAALLQTGEFSVRDDVDLVRGAVDAHLHPGRPSLLPVLSALAGGVLWVVAGLIVLVQPVAPDWPGYLEEMLPVALAGTLLLAVATVGAWLRLGDAMPGASHLALAVAVAGHAIWAAALIAALTGFEYGATTAIAQTAAAAGIVLIGLLLSRSGDWPVALGLLVGGVALVIPHPAGWATFGVAWIAIGLIRAREILTTRAKAGGAALTT